MCVEINVILLKDATHHPTRDSWEVDDHERVPLVLPTLYCFVWGNVTDWVWVLDTLVPVTINSFIMNGHKTVKI